MARERALTLPPARRRFIFGAGGSGKSTLARRLSAEMKAPLLPLDELYWAGNLEYGVRRDPNERDEKMTAFLAQESWVVEGVYWKWTQPVLERADQIVILRRPLWQRQWWTLRRYWRGKVGLESSSAHASLRATLGLMRWNARWDRDHGTKALEQMRPYEAKCIYLEGKDW